MADELGITDPEGHRGYRATWIRAIKAVYGLGGSEVAAVGFLAQPAARPFEPSLWAPQAGSSSRPITGSAAVVPRLPVPPLPGTRVALVIGVSGYLDRSWPPLVNAADDARAVAKKLYYMGYDVTDSIDTSFDKMTADVQSFLRSVKRGDTAVVYLAGHGGDSHGQSYFIPKDCPRSVTDSNAINVPAAIISPLVDIGTKLNVIFVDACRVNLQVRGSRIAEWGKKNTVISYAARWRTTTDDGDPGEGSVYRKSLVKNLNNRVNVTDMITRIQIDMNSSPGSGVEPIFHSNLTTQDADRLAIYNPNPGS